MSYWTIDQMAIDSDLFARVRACAAQEQDDDPNEWASANMLRICASPGWDAKWDSALAGGVEHPGRDEAVISDGDILSAVQAVLGTS